MIGKLKQLPLSFLDFCYPPLCLYCHERVEKRSHLFCYACNHLLEFLDPKRHCIRCFAPLGKKKCQRCSFKGPFYRSLITFASTPVAQTLHTAWTTAPFDLEKSLAELFFARWETLKLPTPAILIPIPSPPFCPSPQAKVARHLADLFNIPLQHDLKAFWHRKTQQLTYVFEGNIWGETILLFDLFYDYQQKFLPAARAARKGGPLHVMALAGIEQKSSLQADIYTSEEV